MEKIRQECPNCHRVFEVDALFAGKNCRCPTCQCELTTPICGDDQGICKKLTRTYNLYLGFSIASIVISAIGFAVALILGVILATWYGDQHQPVSPINLLLIVGSLILTLLAMLAATITALVFKCILLYRFWELVPPDQAATTPCAAVGFLFIPFFNLYWNFVAFLKLGVFLEEKSGSPAPRRLALNCSILPIIGIVANLVLGGAGILFQLATSIVEIVMMASFMNAVRRWRNWER